MTLGRVARAWALPLPRYRAARGRVLVWGCLARPTCKRGGDTPRTSPGRDTLRSGLGGALGSCEGQGLEQGLGSALFNGLRVLSLETSGGNADPGFLCPASVIHEA